MFKYVDHLFLINVPKKLNLTGKFRKNCHKKNSLVPPKALKSYLSTTIFMHYI